MIPVYPSICIRVPINQAFQQERLAVSASTKTGVIQNGLAAANSHASSEQTRGPPVPRMIGCTMWAERDSDALSYFPIYILKLEVFVSGGSSAP